MEVTIRAQVGPTALERLYTISEGKLAFLLSYISLPLLYLTSYLGGWCRLGIYFLGNLFTVQPIPSIFCVCVLEVTSDMFSGCFSYPFTKYPLGLVGGEYATSLAFSLPALGTTLEPAAWSYGVAVPGPALSPG